MTLQRLIVCLFVIAATVLLPVFAVAQSNVNGIYQTESDFMNHVLSDVRSTDNKNYIQSYRTSLKVYRDGIATRHRFGTIFGYHQNGVSYRAYRKRFLFSEGRYCEVLKKGSLSVYKSRSTHHRSNGHIVYYYSEGLTGTLRAFTKRNLMIDFSDKPDFLKEALAQYSKSDPQTPFAISDLYDSFIKEGKKAVTP